MNEQANQVQKAEWTDKRCPECNANLLEHLGYFYCSHVGCNFGLKGDIRIGDLIELEANNYE